MRGGRACGKGLVDADLGRRRHQTTHSAGRAGAFRRIPHVAGLSVGRPLRLSVWIRQKRPGNIDDQELDVVRENRESMVSCRCKNDSEGTCRKVF